MTRSAGRKPNRQPRSKRARRHRYGWFDLLPCLEIAALWAWGSLFLKYWLSGQLRLLIHPNYIWLVVLTGILLLLVAWLKLSQFIARKSLARVENGNSAAEMSPLSSIPQNWSVGILLVTAALGLVLPPTVLASRMALQRGVSESLPLTRTQPQSFRASIQPEERSLVDWVRTFDAYPEPDAYLGQPVRIEGFVIHVPELPEDYLLLARFLVTCCAVDAYPVALPVKIDGSRQAYPPDTWLEVIGEMSVDTLPSLAVGSRAQRDRRQAIVAAHSLETIPTPDDPYNFER
ncbi:putative membrane protein [Rubidibacter lacunae KORDI 51-2]|uniref:Putative membrane protein n=1 Tax=Rubidibacter lacunae KORDI 51-2 TaxID=582515 RepID=U5DMC3_9CHRO|nr:TIGR03943 family protein [Rubidibacter lacunae]ERN42826.1 putative membrane protein [Rubidibacter lacunae KORDI 51-2]